MRLTTDIEYKAFDGSAQNFEETDINRLEMYCVYDERHLAILNNYFKYPEWECRYGCKGIAALIIERRDGKMSYYATTYKRLCPKDNTEAIELPFDMFISMLDRLQLDASKAEIH